MPDIGSLHARCRLAKGPDRHIDVQITALLYPGRFDSLESAKFYATFNGHYALADRVYLGEVVPHYTKSVDSALKLAPSGHVLSCLSEEDTENALRKWFAEYRRGHKTSYDQAFPEWAATAPLALCASALKAICQSKSSNVEA